MARDKHYTKDMTDQDLARSRRTRARRGASKSVVFAKICRGLYMSHEWNMSLSHEAVWSKAIGRKWVLTWKESYMGLMAPSERSQKFDTVKEAREFANTLATRSR